MNMNRLDFDEKMETDDANANNIFLYCQSNGYFKGLLIRMRTMDPLTMKLKVYVRFELLENDNVY